MNRKKTIIHFAIIGASALMLFIGIALTNLEQEDEFSQYMNYYYAVVTEVVYRFEGDLSPGFGNYGVEIDFDARITRGPRRGEIVPAFQYLSNFNIVNPREVAVGDRIILFHTYWSDEYNFLNYNRINYVIIFGLLFLVLVCIFGHKKGVNGIIALGFTCIAIFAIFVPAILGGANIYLATILICAYAMVSTLFIVIGINKKSLSAMAGCIGGVLLAGGAMVLVDVVLQLTGAIDQETERLILLDPPMDIRAIIFAGVILGAMGAIMDVAMTISSSLWEVKEAGGEGLSSFRGIVKSGINIGQDILGTQLNTLILAYIGSSLSLILLLNANNISLTNLFNMEMIVVELVRGLIGSLGMLLTIPLTAVVCGWFYMRGLPEKEDL